MAANSAPPATPTVAAPAATLPVLPPPFALTPAHANASILVYTTDGSRTTYDAMTKQVQAKNEPLFGCKEDSLFQFLVDVRNCANEYKWIDPEGILSIPPLPPAPDLPPQSLVEMY